MQPEAQELFKDEDITVPIAVRFAIQLGQGKIRNGDEAIKGSVEALTVKSERAEQGKDMRGFQRSQALCQQVTCKRGRLASFSRFHDSGCVYS